MLEPLLPSPILDACSPTLDARHHPSRPRNPVSIAHCWPWTWKSSRSKNVSNTPKLMAVSLFARTPKRAIGRTSSHVCIGSKKFTCVVVVAGTPPVLNDCDSPLAMRSATRVRAAGGACAQIRCRSSAARDMELRCVYLSAERIAEVARIMSLSKCCRVVSEGSGPAPNWSCSAGTKI